MKYHYITPYFQAPPHPISVTVIGCGGTGSQVLSGLARINYSLQGLGHPGLFVTAIDNDMVDETNIGRQLFSVSDIGRSKSEVLISRLNGFFGTGWNSVCEKLTAENSANEMLSNIVISCVDSVKSRIEIDNCIDLAKKRKTSEPFEKQYYWMDFGNGSKTAQVVLGTIKPIDQPESKLETTNTLNDVFDQFPELLENTELEDDSPSCSIAQALGKQDLFINSTVAQLGCHLLWKLLTDVRINYRGMYLSLDKMSVNPIKI
jgi:PRTRC genetic system ThiF family protein